MGPDNNVTRPWASLTGWIRGQHFRSRFVFSRSRWFLLVDLVIFRESFSENCWIIKEKTQMIGWFIKWLWLVTRQNSYFFWCWLLIFWSCRYLKVWMLDAQRFRSTRLWWVSELWIRYIWSVSLNLGICEVSNDQHFVDSCEMPVDFGMKC